MATLHSPKSIVLDGTEDSGGNDTIKDQSSLSSILLSNLLTPVTPGFPTRSEYTLISIRSLGSYPVSTPKVTSLSSHVLKFSLFPALCNSYSNLSCPSPALSCSYSGIFKHSRCISSWAISEVVAVPSWFSCESGPVILLSWGTIQLLERAKDMDGVLSIFSFVILLLHF